MGCDEEVRPTTIDVDDDRGVDDRSTSRVSADIDDDSSNRRIPTTDANRRLPANGDDNHDCSGDEDGAESIDSSDEALCEMLGLTSTCDLNAGGGVADNHLDDDDENDHHRSTLSTGSSPQQCQTTRLSPEGIPILDRTEIDAAFSTLPSLGSCFSSLNSSNTTSTTTSPLDIRQLYASESVCIFPESLSVPSSTMRRLTDELVWGSDRYKCDRTYETVRYVVKAKQVAGGRSAASSSSPPSPPQLSEVRTKRVLTRLENFVESHPTWRALCRGHVQNCISSLYSTPMVLFKEKLNLKPPGGSGFAPHLDAPSLRVALGTDGPQNFVTVMIAIDDMTIANGCLRVVPGPWSADHHCPVTPPAEGDDGNPDGGGRAGAIPLDVAESQPYQDVPLKGGRIAAFDGWVPHRSKVNCSPFPRRAVFLTYNPVEEGDFRARYYDAMRRKREEYSDWEGRRRRLDEESELAALASVPRI